MRRLGSAVLCMPSCVLLSSSAPADIQTSSTSPLCSQKLHRCVPVFPHPLAHSTVSMSPPLPKTLNSHTRNARVSCASNCGEHSSQSSCSAAEGDALSVGRHSETTVCSVRIDQQTSDQTPQSGAFRPNRGVGVSGDGGLSRERRENKSVRS